MTTDVIDLLLGPAAAERVKSLRDAKPELRVQMQDYYNSIFAPAPDSEQAFSKSERYLAAVRTTSHTESERVIEWYADRARDEGAGKSEIGRAIDVAEPWTGDVRSSASMRHVDLITAHPVESTKSDIEALSAAGLSPAGITNLSQVVAYVSYQLRLVATFRALGESQ